MRGSAGVADAMQTPLDYMKARSKVTDQEFSTNSDVRFKFSDFRNSLKLAGQIALFAGTLMVVGLSPAHAQSALSQTPNDISDVERAYPALNHAVIPTTLEQEIRAEVEVRTLEKASELTERKAKALERLTSAQARIQRVGDRQVETGRQSEMIQVGSTRDSRYTNDSRTQRDTDIRAERAYKAANSTYAFPSSAMQTRSSQSNLTARDRLEILLTKMPRQGYSVARLKRAVAFPQGVILTNDRETRRPTLFSVADDGTIVAFTQDQNYPLAKQVKEMVYLRSLPESQRTQRYVRIKQMRHLSREDEKYVTAGIDMD